MSIGITNVIKPLKRLSKGRPLLNQVPVNPRRDGSIGLSTILMQKQKFWNWFGTRPELNSPVMIRVDDTITDA